MSAVRLSPLDAAWLFTESRATPNHVGGLLQFQLPANAPRDFMRALMADFRQHRTFTAPWNRRLKYAFNKNPVPAWVEDEDIDLEYHVRHAALPWPGGERELGELVGRLQSSPLDLTRPPWECTIIEGLDGGRFAMFIKMHHSLIDGVSGVNLLQRAMSFDPAKSLGLPPFWASGLSAAPRSRRTGPPPTVAEAAAAAVAGLSEQAKSVPQLMGAFAKILKRIGDPSDGLIVPFAAPRSIINGRVREKRRFATQQFALERLRAVATAAGCTLNDVVLALCGSALRRFLLERESLPEQSLTAGIPVSVRPKDDEGTGNAISFIVSTLGTDIEDAEERLRAIRASVQHAKAHVQALPRSAMLQYTMLLMAPTIVTLLTGVGGRTRPMFNITISNVPGARQAAVLPGCRIAGHLPGFHRHARAGVEHHLPELCRFHELRLHRVPLFSAQLAEVGGLHGRCAGRIGGGFCTGSAGPCSAGQDQVTKQGQDQGEATGGAPRLGPARGQAHSTPCTGLRAKRVGGKASTLTCQFSGLGRVDLAQVRRA